MQSNVSESLGNELKHIFEIRALTESSFSCGFPAGDQEGRDVVFSGQLMAQGMASLYLTYGESWRIRSLDALFLHPGRFSSRLVARVTELRQGRSVLMAQVEMEQDGVLLVVLTAVLSRLAEDTISHEYRYPAVPQPSDCQPYAGVRAFPGADLRRVTRMSQDLSESPAQMGYWVRYAKSQAHPAVSQALLVWLQPGNLIGLALEPHREEVSIAEAHRSLSTGVIRHATAFHAESTADSWHLVIQSTLHGGSGLAYGEGKIFSEERKLLVSFSQQAILRRSDRQLDPSRSL